MVPRRQRLPRVKPLPSPNRHIVQESSLAQSPATTTSAMRRTKFIAFPSPSPAAVSVSSSRCALPCHCLELAAAPPPGGRQKQVRILAPSRLPPALARFYAWRSLFPWHFCIFGRAPPHFIRSQQHEHYYLSYPRMCCGCGLHGRECSRILAPSWFLPAPR